MQHPPPPPNKNNKSQQFYGNRIAHIKPKNKRPKQQKNINNKKSAQFAVKSVMNNAKLLTIFFCHDAELSSNVRQIDRQCHQVKKIVSILV